MAGRNRPVVSDEVINVRIPSPLKVLLEAMSVRHCNTLSYTIVHLLESHPEVASAAESLYDGLSVIQPIPEESRQ